MWKPTSCLVLLLLSNVVTADELPAVTMEAPESWNGERIELPPGFARDMTVRGYEEIRFAPGMFRADSDSFFSYVIVFVLDGEPLEEEALHRELLQYYRGLATAVGAGKGLTIDADEFTLELAEREEEGDADAAEAEEPAGWIGTLNWVEPFVTGKPQELRIEIGVGVIEESDASHVTMCISPKPADAEIWKALHGVRDGVTFSETD